jgi:Transposase
MKRSNFSEEQIAYALRQAEAGTPVGNICWQHGSERGDVLRLEEALRASWAR